MKNSRRRFLKWEAAAGAGMAVPASAQNTRVLTNGQIRTFQGHLSHSLGVQPQIAGLAPFVDPLLVPPMIRPATGSITRTDMKVVQRQLHRDLPPTTAKKAAIGRWAKESALEDPAHAAHRPKPEQIGTFVFI